MCQYLKNSVSSPLLFSHLMLLKDFSFVCDLLLLFVEPITFWQLLSFVICLYHCFKRRIGFPCAGLALSSFSIWIYSQRKNVHVGFLFIHCMCYNFSAVLRIIVKMWAAWAGGADGGEGHSRKTKYLKKKKLYYQVTSWFQRIDTFVCLLVCAVYVNTACFRCRKFSQCFVIHKML